MKLPVLAALALAAASLQAADPAPAAGAAPAPAPSPKPTPEVKPLTPEQQKQAFYLQAFFLVSQSDLPAVVGQLEPTEEEFASMLAGIRAAAKGEQPSFKPDEDFINSAQKFLSERAGAKAGRFAKENEAFLAKIDADKSFTKTASGLRYKIVEAGSGAKPTKDSTVKCRYTGKLIDGKVFDSTTTRNNEPTEFPLSQVIPAWTEGVQLIAKGGKIVLFAPAALAYGERGQGPIPGGAVLEFEVELVDFK